jgi:hypothetical protein
MVIKSRKRKVKIFSKHTKSFHVSANIKCVAGAFVLQAALKLLCNFSLLNEYKFIQLSILYGYIYSLSGKRSSVLCKIKSSITVSKINDFINSLE